MQAIAKRTEKAVRKAERRRLDRYLKAKADTTWELRQQLVRREIYENKLAKQRRANRIEDWERGPLAPRRDVGLKKGTYGSVPFFEWTQPKKQEADRPKWWPVGVGDRVVVLRGREQNKIGSIESVDLERGTVELSGMNLTYVELPTSYREKYRAKLQPIAAGIPLEDVRLVYPLPHPKTGVIRDTVIERLERVSEIPLTHKKGGSLNWSRLSEEKREALRGHRVIAGTNTIIPWHPILEEQEVLAEDDTDPELVGVSTVQHHLLRVCMPPSVIDELRGKYSAFRTRHTPEFIEKLEAIDARTQGREVLAETAMRTPLQEMAAMKRQERERQRADESRDLTEEQLAKIGELMLAEREATSASRSA